MNKNTHASSANASAASAAPGAAALAHTCVVRSPPVTDALRASAFAGVRATATTRPPEAHSSRHSSLPTPPLLPNTTYTGGTASGAAEAERLRVEPWVAPDLVANNRRRAQADAARSGDIATRSVD